MVHSSRARAARQRVVVLNDPNAMRINKDLAEEIGFQESVVFLQIEFLVSISDHEIDGRRWTRQTLEELHKEHFPWWSIATIKRILARLQERNLVVSDTHNKVGYDRTQWYAIDPVGVAPLHSIAIFQNEKPIYHPDPIEELTMQNGSAQDDTTIPETTYKTTDKEKGAKAPSRPPRKLKVSDQEAEERWDALLSEDANADVLARFAEFRAEQNRAGEIKVATLWRQIGEEYVGAKPKLSDAALRYGIQEALRHEKASIRYALAVARNHRVESPGARNRGRNSIAVIGAKDEDYNEEEYRFHA